MSLIKVFPKYIEKYENDEMSANFPDIYRYIAYRIQGDPTMANTHPILNQYKRIHTINIPDDASPENVKIELNDVFSLDSRQLGVYVFTLGGRSTWIFQNEQQLRFMENVPDDSVVFLLDVVLRDYKCTIRAYSSISFIVFYCE